MHNSVSFSYFFLLKNRVARRERNDGERDARENNYERWSWAV